MTAVVTGLVISAALLAEVPTSNEWLADYGRALDQAEIEGVPLLVVIDRPARDDQRVSQVKNSEDQAQEALLSNYKLCHVDAETEYGRAVAKAFRASEFPHTVIIDRTVSTILYRKNGQFSTDEWQATLAKYRRGERETVAYSNLNTSSRRRGRLFCST